MVRMPWVQKRAVVLKATADEAEIARLLAQQDGVSTDIQQAFLDAVNRAAANLDMQRIIQFLQNNDIAGAIDYVNSQLTAQTFQPLANVISQTALSAGIDAANYNPDLGQTDFVFGTVNPQTTANLATYDFGLITNLTDDTRASIAQVIRDGVADGRNPLDIARDVRQYIGLTPRQATAARNFQDALESGDSMALNYALRDKRFDSTVQRAIDGEDVLSADQIENMVGRYTQRQLGSRANTIARTEAMRAVNRGNMEAWKQAGALGSVDPDQVVRFWYHSHDDLVRESHLEIPDLNPDGVGLDEPFQTPLGELMYPGDPEGEPADTINCRCTLIYRIRTPGVDLKDYGADL